MTTPIDRARKSLVEVHQIDAGTATLAIHVLVDELTRPDADMLRAGGEELRRAIPRPEKGRGFDAYIRDLAAVVFHAMLARADFTRCWRRLIDDRLPAPPRPQRARLRLHGAAARSRARRRFR